VEEIRRALGGSSSDRAAAFSSLLDRTLDRSFRLAAVILGNRAEAEDAISDAALRAWQHVGSLRDPARFDAWFSRIVVNVCRDRLHGRRRPSVLYLEVDQGGEALTGARAGAAPPDAFAASDERAALRQALSALTPDHRAVIALHYLEGLTVDEIAVQLGTPAGTVKSRLHYGLASMRAAYEAAAREPQGVLR
jgi:RNA polymerase sigma-70 factor (ECF subfamily)